MQTISDFPYSEVQFSKEGRIFDDREVTDTIDFLKKGGATDLIVISHGWNNDMADARRLYNNVFAKIRSEFNAKRIAGIDQKKIAVLGILWPSKKFTDDELKPSGAAGIETSDEEQELVSLLDSLKGGFDHPDSDVKLEKAKKLLRNLDNDPNAAAEIVELFKSLPNKEETQPEEGSEEFFDRPSTEIVDILSRPDVLLPGEEDTGGAADFGPATIPGSSGSAAGFDLFGSITSAIRNALNFTTYYQMKQRAGIVGKGGAYQVLARIRQEAPNVKIHLVGHSFGGRLVTAIANGPQGGKPILPESMTLLQAAFSHNGFGSRFDGQRDGFFRKVLSERKVKGPIIITHSIRDSAVGTAYPIASKLSGDDAAAFGDAASRYGGIGRNGAQHTPEADNSVPLGRNTTIYKFVAGKVHNLKADNIIMHHSDIARSEVAHAILSAL